MTEQLPDVDSTGATVERLLDALATNAGPAAARYGEQLVRALIELYGVGLARMVELADPQALSRFAADRAVAGLLILHDLHPEGTEQRVREALQRLRPYLGRHGGEVELLGVTGTVARVRIGGGCPSSTTALQEAIERAVAAAAPEVDEVVVEAPTRPSELPLLQIQTGVPR